MADAERTPERARDPSMGGQKEIEIVALQAIVTVRNRPRVHDERYPRVNRQATRKHGLPEYSLLVRRIAALHER